MTEEMTTVPADDRLAQAPALAPAPALPSAQAHIAALGELALDRLGRHLARRFGRPLLISTLNQAARRDDLDAEARDDLEALAEALPPGRLSLDPQDRDDAADEPAMLRFVRQAEGTPPALPAVLLPHSLSEIEAVLAEADAAGYGLSEGRRPIGLSFRGLTEARAGEDGSGEAGIESPYLRFGAGASWSDAAAAAEAAGGTLPASGLSDRFPRPIDAAAAGVLRDAVLEAPFGRPAAACLPLPPGGIGLTDKTWLLRDEAAAAALFDLLVRRHRPLFAELLPVMDAEVMAAAGLWRGGRKIGRAAGLRFAVEGTRAVRAAQMAEIGWVAERAGGVCHHRGALPAADLLDALAAASGAARVEAAPGAKLPAGAVAGHGAVAVEGRLRHRRLVWYPRDLSRSLEEMAALAAPAPPADAGRPARGHAGGAHQDGEAWEALREALAEALP